jgi:anti-sigma regulatory factor (Ser/Thr protein kinase)
MVKLRKRGEEVRQFILENIDANPKDIIRITAQKFNVTRQAVHKHIRMLMDKNILTRDEQDIYRLRTLEEWSASIKINNDTQEDVVWRNEVSGHLGLLPDNAANIWRYGFTEIFNNVIDHSESPNAGLTLKKTALSTEIIISDRGVGIFNKIQSSMKLLDERHAVLELTKGKLTTDPAKHTGEGIFFSSRMFDEFAILSGSVYLSHTYGQNEDWIMETQRRRTGTTVFMKLKNKTSRTTKEIFDKFTSEEDFGFTKTIVPVRLAQYGNESLISRSQAKRLLDRIDRFKIVIFDFTGVQTIGRAFADEVFRVFANQHPSIEILPINASTEVRQMINRVTSDLK